MTVHTIQAITSTEGDYTLAELNTAMNEWVSQQSEWMADPDRHHMSELVGADAADPSYRVGIYRFEIADAKENLLQKCEDKLVNKVQWYRLGYHECSHDEDPTTPCQWNDQRQWTAKDATIPDGVPTFTTTG